MPSQGPGDDFCIVNTLQSFEHKKDKSETTPAGAFPKRNHTTKV